jgi:2-methylcitrate dehydratase
VHEKPPTKISPDNLESILAVSDWLCRSSKAGVIKHKGLPLTLKTLLVVVIKA